MTTLTVYEEKGARVIRFTGPLDAAEVGRLEPTFQKASGLVAQGLLIDLEKVTMVATPALSMFIATVRSRRKGDGRIIFTGTKGPIDYLLHMCRLDKVLKIVADREAALTTAAEKMD